MRAMTAPTPPGLDEIAKANKDALEAALEEMVDSGFGALDVAERLPAPQPIEAPAPTPSTQ
jgi:hypothetical protein